MLSRNSRLCFGFSNSEDGADMLSRNSRLCFGFSNSEDGTDMLSRNVGKMSPLLAV